MGVHGRMGEGWGSTSGRSIRGVDAWSRWIGPHVAGGIGNEGTRAVLEHSPICKKGKNSRPSSCSGMLYDLVVDWREEIRLVSRTQTPYLLVLLVLLVLMEVLSPQR